MQVAALVAALGVLALIVWLLIGAGDRDRVPEPAQQTAEADGAARAADVGSDMSEPEERVSVEREPGSEPMPEPPSDAAPRLLGRVVRAEDGTPIAGATVELRFRDADDFENLDMEYGKRIETLATMDTDAEGRFTFPAARGRSHRIHARAHGFAARTLPDCVASPGEIVIELGRGAILTGTVRCEGEAVPDVPVTIAVVGEAVPVTSTRTDAGGMFRVEELQPADVFAQVHSPEHRETWERCTLTEGGTHHVEIDLPPSRTIPGRIIDGSSGAPVVGARVATTWTFKRFVSTAADGRFAIPYVGADELAGLHVRADGYAAATRNVSPDVKSEIVIALEHGAEISGRVVDEFGAGLPGTYVAVGASFVSMAGAMHTDWIRARVDGHGMFVARGLRSDQSYWLYARHRSYGTKVHALPGRLAVDQRLDVGEVVLRAAGGVEGRVVDERDEPLAGLTVTLNGRNADAGAWTDEKLPRYGVHHFESREQQTSAGGSFAFAEVAAGKYLVSAHPPSGGPRNVTAEVEVVDGALVTDVRLVLSSGESIIGRLRRSDGLPLGTLDDPPQVHASNGGRTRVDADGSFRLERLEAGQSHDLTVWNLPDGLVAAPVRDVAVGTRGVEIVVEPAAKISGRVVGANGEGRSAVVFLIWDPPMRGSTPIHRTDADGFFEIAVPQSFAGKVQARPQDFPLPGATLPDVKAGATDLELVLR